MLSYIFVYMWFNASCVFMRILVYFVGFQLSSSDSPSRWLCGCLNFSGGATNNNLMSWSRAMELMFELVCLNLCEFVNLCIWTYVNLRTYIFGLMWICDMNIYQCVWNLYCMWYIVLHVILCVSNFTFLYFLFFSGKGLRTWVPMFLRLRTWVPSNLLCSPRRPT